MGTGLEDTASPGPVDGGSPERTPVTAARRRRDLPLARVLARPATWGVLAAISVAVALAWTALGWRTDLLDPTSPTGDPWNYLAAAERLRDGHALYSISPGDRPVAGYPGQYALPLMAPPTVAILWLPLLVLPPNAAMTLWAVGGLMATLSTIAWTIVRGGIAVRAFVILLAYPVATTALSGNVNAYLLPVLMCSWLGLFPGRGAVGGAATGVAAIARVGPALIGLLYVVRRRWLATSAAATVVLGAVALSVVVAGTDAWRTYVDASIRGVIAPTGLSVPGMLAALGFEPPITTTAQAAVWLIAALAIVALRDRPRWAFVVAIVGAIYATPVVRMESWALLLAAAAPWLVRADLASQAAPEARER